MSLFNFMVLIQASCYSIFYQQPLWFTYKDSRAWRNKVCESLDLSCHIIINRELMSLALKKMNIYLNTQQMQKIRTAIKK